MNFTCWKFNIIFFLILIGFICIIFTYVLDCQQKKYHIIGYTEGYQEGWADKVWSDDHYPKYCANFWRFEGKKIQGSLERRLDYIQNHESKYIIIRGFEPFNKVFNEE